MGSKEVRNWRSEEALERYRMIMPLLDPEIDNAKRCMLLSGTLNDPSNIRLIGAA